MAYPTIHRTALTSEVEHFHLCLLFCGCGVLVGMTDLLSWGLNFWIGTRHANYITGIAHLCTVQYYLYLLLLQACFSAGMFALTALNVEKEEILKRDHFLRLAREIATTCHESYNRTGKFNYPCII